ncbi:MAG: hypothetical protein OJF49_000858 [Ktedonobacterales bacterium]|nr:MAG: hypothetical protein OJF49_000858 [Ktedonobacterales bacterium]
MSMDDGNQNDRAQDRRGAPPRAASGPRQNPAPRRPQPSDPNSARQGGGLLSRYAGGEGGSSPENKQNDPGATRPPTSSGGGADGSARGNSGNSGNSGNGGNGLLSRARQGGPVRRNTLHAFTGQVRRLGDNLRKAAENIRAPRAGEWRASDFDRHELKAWDENDEAPFDVPDEPEFGDERPRRSEPRPRDGAARGGSSRAPRGSGAGGGGGGGRGQPPRRRAPDTWDDDEWNADFGTGTWDTGWATGSYDASSETGTWDSGWATGYEPSLGGYDDEEEWGGGRRGRRGDGALEDSLGTLAQLGAVHPRMGRLARTRLLLRKRPAAAAMLAFFLFGFILACCAPIVPILRLGYDATDALRRINNVQTMLADQSALFNAEKLKAAQSEVDGLTRDLYEINSAMNVVGAPLAAVNPTVRNYRLLTRIGFDLTATADEALQVAQTVLTPLQGGALAADSSSPGLTMNDITQARAVLADASVRVQDALEAYHQLSPDALNGSLKKFSKYLSLLPQAPPILAEMTTLLDSVPALLGIGQPANYLVIAMDRTELRPAGGFMGNYGILTLTGGRQDAKHPLALDDTYNLDSAYYQAVFGKAPPGTDCYAGGPQPPNYYWWWPYRNFSCQFEWGLRDSGLSPDFPINAQTAMRIVEDTPNSIPGGGQLQGVIAFTPVLIEDLLLATGPIILPNYNNQQVTAQNMQALIHKYQLDRTSHSAPRKQFTHDLAQALLARVKKMHGSQLKAVLKVGEQALKSKDLQLYFSDPHAELILRQLGLSSEISRGNGDGFFVVDTNDGGNKANQFVTEKQTDYITLLPNGGALHRLQISVTYYKQGDVFNKEVPQEDYVDMQRTYLPGDATILGYSGFIPANFWTPDGCSNYQAAIVVDCTDSPPVHEFQQPTTISDVPGRSMVFGGLVVSCRTETDPSLQVETRHFFSTWQGTGPGGDYDQGCPFNASPHTQNIYITWYTPHAFTMDANGHGTYTELVEKQAGSGDFLLKLGNYLTVYVDTSQLHAKNPNLDNVTITSEDQWAALLQGKKPLKGYDNLPLDQNTVVTFGF